MFSQLLGRMRIGHSSSEDIEALKGQIVKEKCETAADIAKIYVQLKEKLKPEESICCLFSMRAAANELNREMLTQDNIDTVTLKCIDKYGRHRQRAKAFMKRGKKNKKRSITETGGLEDELVLGIGATVGCSGFLPSNFLQVMLRRNLDAEVGLVNGKMGTVVGFEKSHLVKTNEITHIVVQFKGITEPQRIGRVDGDWELSAGIIVTRQQFPLILAYAITIHKSQGV